MSMKILIVDDDADIRQVLSLLLKESYTVAEAADGAAALDFLQRNPDTDLVILDVMMPGLSGYETCDRLREFSNVPVLFLTAKSAESDRLSAYGSGGEDFLSKPFSQGEIEASEMYGRAEKPLRIFMYNQLRDNPENIRLFMNLSGLPKPANLSEVPTYVLVPAFALNELTVAFRIGVLIFIPFLVIDMIVASILVSMGMVMVPPVMVSLPFKLMVFVLADGWNLIIGRLLSSFI